MKAVIIEDEVMAIKHLKQVIHEVGGISVIAALESITESVEWFSKNIHPDIVFMDIQLADGLSFEIFKHVKISCPVIFTTAYDEYALKAFKVNSIDYLLKPVDMEDVKKAITKLNELSNQETMKTAVENIISYYHKGTRFKTHFLIPIRGDKLIPLQVSDLACFYIDSGIVKAYSRDGKTYRMDYKLEELSEMLNPDDFYRANRQYIISRKAIRDIDLWFNNRLSINLDIEVPEKILISKARITEFKNWMGC